MRYRRSCNLSLVQRSTVCLAQLADGRHLKCLLETPLHFGNVFISQSGPMSAWDVGGWCLTNWPALSQALFSSSSIVVHTSDCTKSSVVFGFQSNTYCDPLNTFSSTEIRCAFKASPFQWQKTRFGIAYRHHTLIHPETRDLDHFPSRINWLCGAVLRWPCLYVSPATYKFHTS